MGIGSAASWRWLVAAWAASTGIAHAAYQCHDGWGRTFRLPLAPVQLGDALHCTPVPPGERGTATSEPVAEVGTARAIGPASPVAEATAPRRGRLVMTVEAAVKTVSPGDASQPHPFDPLISAAARRYGHDERLIKAIVYVESRFDPGAVSPKGAVGLMQLMPATASELGVASSSHLFDPALNLDTGARHLRRLMDTFADRPDLAIAAYNAGESAVLRHGRRVPPYPETQNYVRDVLAQFDRLRMRGKAGGVPGG